MRGRREFLGYLVGGGLALLGAGCQPKPSGTAGKPAPSSASGAPQGALPPSSVVAVAQVPDALRERELRQDEVDRLLARGIEEFSRAKAPDFWAGRFAPRDVVAVKVNCLAGPRLSTSGALVLSIVTALRAAGLPRENIWVFDSSRRVLQHARYEEILGGHARIAGTDEPGIGYDDEAVSLGAFTSRFSRIVATYATAIINVPILKDHDFAGVTFSVKNHLGCIDNPSRCHDNDGDPAIACVSGAPVIREKQRLVVGDALLAAFEGGPSYNPAGVWRRGALIIGADPVAVDCVGLWEIEKKRKAAGLDSLEKDERFPRYLVSAAKMGLGNFGPARVEERRVTVE